MTSASTDPSREARLRGLAATIFEHIELEHVDSTQEWTYAWTDGPTAEQVRRVAEAAEPHAALGLRYVRRFSENAIALGAVRLAVATSAADTGRRPEISPSAVEELWRDVPHPSPATERERLLVYAVLYEAHDNRRRNEVPAHEICELIAQSGLAPFLRRTGGALTPIETLTAHYAPTHAHPAWRYRLAPMTATAAFEAVRHDPNASRELIEAALTLLPELPETYDSAADHLRARLERIERTA
jgi:hypothetical protein